MSAPRIRHCQSQHEYQSVVDDFHTQGFKIKGTPGQTSTMMDKKGWGSGLGHLLVFIFFGWWTLGFANLIFAILAHLAQGERVVVKLDQHFDQQVYHPPVQPNPQAHPPLR